MDRDREIELLQLLGSKGTRGILQELSTRGKVKCTDFHVDISIPTLYTKLTKLLEFSLIEHHLEKEPTRQEWYEITEKGRKILRYLEDLVELIYRSGGID
jgi:DNA-binding PadR family transcriptional regulator